MENRFDNPFQPEGIPQGLKVLTVLSMIGCAIQFIGGMVNFAFAKSLYDMQLSQLETAQSPDMPAWARNMIPDPELARVLMEKTYDNRIPIFILGIISAVLCFYGVLQMRKLKKQGFPFYVIGELLPFLTTALFVGTSAMKGFFFYFTVFISLLFIGLYAGLRRRMV